jgi:hypothetical protein
MLSFKKKDVSAIEGEASKFSDTLVHNPMVCDFTEVPAPHRYVDGCDSIITLTHNKPYRSSNHPRSSSAPILMQGRSQSAVNLSPEEILEQRRAAAREKRRNKAKLKAMQSPQPPKPSPVCVCEYVTHNVQLTFLVPINR